MTRIQELEGEVAELESLVRELVGAIQAQKVFWPIIKTRDCGTCQSCGGMTSSGMDKFCKKCAIEKGTQAIVHAKKVIGEGKSTQQSV